MKSLTTIFTVFITCLALFSTTADAARRLGGGSSFGKQREVPAQQQQRSQEAAPRQATPPAQTPPQQQQGNRWMGPLAGLAIGAGLGALFSNFFSGTGGSVLLAIFAAVVALVLIRRFMRPRHAQTQFQTAQGPLHFERETVKKPTFDIPPIGGASSAMNENTVAAIPADFPVDSFLRGAKATFIRLQAANDRKDLDDIREYTTPEVFAEIALQMQERGEEIQITNVIKLNAEVLEAVTEGNLSIASVRFTGEIAENGEAPEQMDEIWNVQRDLRDAKSGWRVAGIQQTTLH
jgi:predicted lipid-binding transport protein (Tim44 family)